MSGHTIPWSAIEYAREGDTRILVLPTPPSGNAAYRAARSGRIYSAASWVAYQQALRTAWLALGSVTRGALLATGEVGVIVTWYRNRRAGDLANREKTADDAVQHLLYADDRQIVYKLARRVDIPRDQASCLRVEVFPYDGR